VIATEYNPPFKKVNGDAIKNEFDTSHKIMKEDWNEWMRRCSVEMLKHTPNPVIMSCFSIAEVYS
jgi:FKBP12-rapamycin complex-associated protein